MFSFGVGDMLRGSCSRRDGELIDARMLGNKKFNKKFTAA